MTERRPVLGAGDAVVGLVLAAGAGRRYGQPKALVRDGAGVPWLQTRVAALITGGCDRVLVVLGAEVGAATLLVPAEAQVVVAGDWQDGLRASLRAGLERAAELEPPVAAALVALVDTPGLTPAAVHRLLGVGASPDVLARATYAGAPGHPVLLGRNHWRAATSSAPAPGGRTAPAPATSVGLDSPDDPGARDYLKRAGVVLVECGDVADGADVDHHGHRHTPTGGAPRTRLARTQLVEDARAALAGLGEHGADGGGDHLLVAFADLGQGVAHEVHPAALPRRALQHGADGEPFYGQPGGGIEITTGFPIDVSDLPFIRFGG